MMYFLSFRLCSATWTLTLPSILRENTASSRPVKSSRCVETLDGVLFVNASSHISAVVPDTVALIGCVLALVHQHVLAWAVSLSLLLFNQVKVGAFVFFHRLHICCAV